MVEEGLAGERFQCVHEHYTWVCVEQRSSLQESPRKDSRPAGRHYSSHADSSVLHYLHRLNPGLQFTENWRFELGLTFGVRQAKPSQRHALRGFSAASLVAVPLGTGYGRTAFSGYGLGQ